MFEEILNKIPDDIEITNFRLTIITLLLKDDIGVRSILYLDRKTVKKLLVITYMLVEFKYEYKK